ncbi:MAG TPA: RNA polymerase sigma factor [Candidatus Acidoferrum sp.]|nr:RNA polymerase sigma factor [Candidatus Acidoferrum sp.]
MVIQQPAESGLLDADREEAVEFQAAFERTSRSAFLLARHMGRTTEEAQDIVQEAALRGWRYRGGRTGEFRSWFLTIVYRLCRRPSLPWLPLPASWERAVPVGIDSQLDPDLIAALKGLPVRQRAAVWLRYCEDLSINEVARVMRCSQPAVKQLTFRGCEAIRLRLTVEPVVSAT